MRPDDDVVLGNTAFALYYINSPDAVAALEKFIAAAEDNAALAEQVLRLTTCRDVSQVVKAWAKERLRDADPR
ncbi:MAG: hypothetical protein HGA90_06055 [Alphaproteobacteria bacterium]|nr:hypothetical protein [Alphaproteobacteria bacterium]